MVGQNASISSKKIKMKTNFEDSSRSNDLTQGLPFEAEIQKCTHVLTGRSRTQPQPLPQKYF